MSASRLLWVANAVLALVPQLRATSFIDDLAQLRQKLLSTLVGFGVRARAAGVDAARTAQATDVLAAVLDQVVTSMPWGAEVGWQSLCATARKRAPAERLLEIVGTANDAGMRELVGVALALGFDRRQGTADQGVLEQIRARLDIHAVSLAPPPQLRIERRRALGSWLPLWVSSLAAAAVLAMLFAGLELSLGTRSDRLYAQLAELNGATANTPAVTAPTPRFSTTLAAQVAGGNLTVRDEVDRSVLVIPAARLFAGQDTAVHAAGGAVLRAVASAIGPVAGRVQVIGHTDPGQPRSAQYVSDWEWSVERARAVRDALQSFGIDAKRLSYDGRAAVEPLTSHDPAHAPGDNARVEIIVLVGR